MKKTCRRGHTFFKTSDCPTCPRCEEERRPTGGLLSVVSAPARRALEREGITSLKKLSRYSKSELLRLHGLGPSTLPKLEKALAEEGLRFRTEGAAPRDRAAPDPSAAGNRAMPSRVVHGDPSHA